MQPKSIQSFLFLIFGNTYLIIYKFNLRGISNELIYSLFFCMTYILLFFTLFFQMIFLNILSLLLLLIFIGFKKFILEFEDFIDFYAKKLLLILIHILFGTFCICFYLWNKLINDAYISNDFFLKFLIFFPCAIMSIIIYYPQRLLINIVSIIIVYIYQGSFSNLLYVLDHNFENAFNYSILE